jgi:hypothetical protein
MNALVRYEAACRAVAEARSVDEILLIHDQARALAACARVAKNRDLEADAVEIRLRATRRLDQLRQAQKDSVGLATGGEHGGRAGIDGLRKNPSNARPTLASQGIDKNLAHHARVLGGMKDEAFERTVHEARDSVSQVFRRTVRAAEHAQERASYTLETPQSLLPLPAGRRMRVARNGSKRQWMLAIGPNISQAKLKEREQAARETAVVQGLERQCNDRVDQADALEAEAKRIRQEAEALRNEITVEIKKAVGPAEPFTVTYKFQADEETDAVLAALSDQERTDRLVSARGAIDASLEETERGYWGDMTLMGSQPMSPGPGGPRSSGWTKCGSPEWLDELFPDWNEATP